jgi:hypothetical protein
VDAYDSSAVTVSGAEVETWLNARGSSNVTIIGGWASVFLSAFDSSTVTMRSGSMGTLNAYASSTFTMTGGDAWSLFAYDSSAVRISGGTVGDDLYASDSSTITIAGWDFAVDGSPVPYGDLTALTGTLTGTLMSGDPIDNEFYQGGGSYSGTITLVQSLLPALSSWGKLALGATLLGAGSLGVVVRRRQAG